MPRAPVFQGPCLHVDGANTCAPLRVQSNSSRWPMRFMESTEDEFAGFPVTPYAIHSDSDGGHRCRFYHECVCLLGEFHPGFGKAPRAKEGMGQTRR